MKFNKQPFYWYISTILIIVYSLFDVSSLKAQAQNNPPLSYYSLWGGYSFTSVKFLGKTQNSQTQILALGFRKEITSYKRIGKLYYSADLIPYLRYHYPKRDEANRRVNRRGFGISPIGFLWERHSMKKISPFVHTTGGLIFMESNFPTDLARRLNFTFDITLGANFRLGRVAMLSFGYKFHHISNAETGQQNPGIDSNFLFISLSTQ